MSEIIVLLDESGSMGDLNKEPVNAVNLFINSQKNAVKEEGSVCNFSFYTFNTETKCINLNTPIQEVKDFVDYEPEGGTALFDCICRAIEEKKDKENVVFVILTDGQDRDSKNFTQAETKQKINQQETEKNWKFVYLAANLQAFNESQSLGIGNSRLTTASTQSDFSGAMRHLSASVSCFRRSKQKSDLSPNFT